MFIQVGNSLELNCTVTGKDLEDLDIAQYLSWKFFKNKTGQEMESRIIDGNISTLVIDDVGVNHTGAFSGVINVTPKCLNEYECSYHWTSDGENLYKNFEQVESYEIEIDGTSKLGNISFKKHVDPVTRVKMSSFKKVYVQYSNSTSLKLVLKLPDSASYLPSLFDTMYRVLYKSKWDDDFKMVKKTVLNDYFKNTPDTLTLTNLVPNTNYNISVSAKIVDAVGDRYWSDPFIMTGKTGCDVPGALPEFTGSSFQITQQIKTVKIYMKPLPDKMKNSPFVNYSLTFEELGKNGTLLSLETRDYPESVMLHPNVQLNLNNEYNIKIQVIRVIYLFSSKRTVGRLQVSSKVMFETKTNYIYVMENNENLNWSIEPSNTTSLSININEVENFDKWIFGVSLEKKNNFSSGISWGNCYFSHFDQVDDIPSPNFFSVQSVRGSEKALEVKITGYCNILNGNLLNVRPDNYTIIYGKISAPSTKPKDINSGNITGSSFTVTWGTTENPNGPIISYDITLELLKV
ncbi:hypothetical protein KUTeg_016635 [Tegillarca granosa]|uniref:Fibronectin type-III domain-containing protein n=1 Tax=Tegillarca granosa TaxID=220873 RepID=A0ABQ9ERR3_TEGGR|nr:hypothetical protein KUTeg_016635 [Tegillarca granosa]